MLDINGFIFNFQSRFILSYVNIIIIII